MSELVDEFVVACQEADLSTRQERAERAARVARLGWPESGWAFFGDHGVAGPWNELRRTFVDGSFVATILIGQAFLENLLGGLLHWQEEPVDTAGLAGLLQRTWDRGWLTSEEFHVLDALRRVRNPYAHYRNFQHSDSLVQRAIAAEEIPDALVEGDAWAVVEALYHLVNRQPFALGTIMYPHEEEPWVHPDQMHLPL